MAPSRKRAAAKAAAAAAACRQWKVGDLVLAKVKGFPAWPATVSEPEKWGYQPDWRKVLVYFFGTQQIAFCYPADVEAFTEEKKQSLLTKRQGKGADFVCAVKEISDSYDKLKKQEQVRDLNCGDEVTLASGGNSMESPAQLELKGLKETSEVTVTGRHGPSVPTSDATDVEKSSSLHDREASLEQPTDNAVVTEKPITTTYTSRKRSGGLRSRKRVMHEKPPSVERTRSSSRLESYGFQNFIKPSNDGRSVGDLSNNVTQDRSLRRCKRSRRSPDGSDCDDDDLSAFVSNCSIEDNGSEIITGDSDSFSLNEGSTLDSGCRLERSENVVEVLEEDVELSKGLGFQIKAAVIKKKRKPIRKETPNEEAEPAAKLETEADLEVGMHNGSKNSQNVCETLKERYNKDDGDEHLPLVKRARVRMGKPSSLEEVDNDCSQVDEKTPVEVAFNLKEEQNKSCQPEARSSYEAAVSKLDQTVSPASCDKDLPDGRISLMVKEAPDFASSPKVSTQILGNRSQILGVKEIQSFGCPADGEAALPPSKRLHRALEAMSANAAEESQVFTESPTMKTVINDSSISSIKCSFHMDIESKDGNGLQGQNIETFGNRVSAFCSTSNSVVEECNKSSSGADFSSMPIEFSTSQEPCKGISAEAMEQDEYTDCVSHQASIQCLTPDLDKRQTGVQSNHGSLDPLISQKDGDSNENTRLGDLGAQNPNDELDTSGHSGTSQNQTSQADKAAECASENGNNVLFCSADHPSYVHTESLISRVDDNSQANSMFEVAKDAKSNKKKTGASYSSVSNGHISDKDTLGQSSPPPGDEVGSPARTSPPTTLICHVSTSESANCIQTSGYSSPNIHSSRKKTVCTAAIDGEKVESAVSQRPKPFGKCSSNYSEVNAALSSFEAMLGSLTRTKESIGRATRIAIDCAKLGVSSKAVEILARSLETESSMHRRVDLFFLVDSITQCSRGMKGQVGGVYPSAIQAALPRLLSAAAPPGSNALENRRQCSKVLKLWLERKIFPESIVRHHMRELDSFGGSASAGPYSRRSARTERALDDPVRDMEGMLVDEYGSNSSFQLPGFCMPRMLRDEDEGGDSDGGSFEVVTPEHTTDTPEEQETTPAMDKHTRILEDVDGELEMEDVAPSFEVEMKSTSGISEINVAQNSHVQFPQQFSVPFIPPLPQDVPPSSPPLPLSPPPPPPPPPPLPVPPPPTASVPLSCVMLDPYTNGLVSKNYKHTHDPKNYTSSHSVQIDPREPVAQQSIPRMNSSVSNTHYHAPECRDQVQAQPCETTSSYSNYPARPLTNIRNNDGCNFHHSAYPPRPPLPPPPSNQFSFVQPAQHVRSQRDTPPRSYSNRLHSCHSADSGNFYNNHERMRPAPYEQHSESRRFSAPHFPGPRYHDDYPPVPYGGPPRDQPQLPHQEWYPPRGMHHRDYMPFRPQSESAVPVSSRAPSNWRPR